MESYPFGDRRMPHHVFPPKFFATSELPTVAGVHLYKIDLDDTMAVKKRLTRVKTEWGVEAMATVLTLDNDVVDLNTKLDQMYEPSGDEAGPEVCLVLDGSLYVDVELADADKWVRIHLTRGDLLVLPKGVCHRSTTTPANFVKLQRFIAKSHKEDDG